MPSPKIPSYEVFKTEVFEKINSNEKNILFYWSLTDSSGWEEFEHPNYFPDVQKGIKDVVKILKKSPEFKKLIEGTSQDTIEKFVQSEYLSNYLLGTELELKLGSDWILDTKKLEKFKRPEFPDLTFRKGKRVVYLEIKGQLSPANLKERVLNEVCNPYLRSNSYENFVLLLLFPVCSEVEYPARVYQLIKGYYVYEEIIRKGSGILYLLQRLFPNINIFQKDNSRRVYCQCFVDKKKYREEIFTIENLAERIYKSYFIELNLLN